MSGQDLNVQGDIQNELKLNVQAKYECPGKMWMSGETFEMS